MDTFTVAGNLMIETFYSLIATTIAVISLVISLYSNIIAPRLAAKPKLEYSADHYFIGDGLASHDYFIRNSGDAPSKDVGMFMALKPPLKIVKISCDPISDNIEDGEGRSKVKLSWKKLPPKNFISVKIVSEADKKIPETVFPMEFKLWDKKSIIGAYEFKP